MIVELVNTGSELMLGRVLNTHQQWLCRQLADLGYVVNKQVAISDTGKDIEQTVREGLSRADLIITTGGLGPTSDDITRDLIARLLGKSLHEDDGVLENLRHFFEIRKRPMMESTRVQALVPDESIVLPNAYGTAPGLAIEVSPNPFRVAGQKSWLIMLPGPPRELKPMFTEKVIPLLNRIFPLEHLFVCRTLRTSGIGESMVQERIHEPLAGLVLKGLEVGYCARIGQVDVRLSGIGAEAVAMVDHAEKVVRENIGSFIFGVQDEQHEQLVVRALAERKQTLAVAESCTGGLLSHRLTNVPGASAVLLAGLVTYSNEAKEKFLGVRSETVAQHGAVSEAVAKEMAEGARRQTGADFAVSITGIAGPSGGTADKPVGTVFIGFAGADQTVAKRNFNPYDRETFKLATTDQALDFLRQHCLTAKTSKSLR